MKIAQLARKLKKHHAESHSWQKTANAFGVEKSVAHGIALRGYDPADQATRKTLGLGPRICPSCKRKATVPRTYKPKPISRQSRKELLWSLQNRVVIQ